ncbi:MAG TPA: PIN domain-containing protein [Pseudonocardiaceae bacterium]|jgi:tRNA(fMet)-specific endonuclease VapC
MARLILDTGVLIGVARGRLGLASVVTDEDDVAVPAVVVAEFLAGVIQDHDPGRKAQQRGFLDNFLTMIPVAPYDMDTIERHAELLAHTRVNGCPRGAHDLIIAATAIVTDRTLLTTDAKAGFDELPGVSVQLIAR